MEYADGGDLDQKIAEHKKSKKPRIIMSLLVKKEKGEIGKWKLISLKSRKLSMPKSWKKLVSRSSFKTKQKSKIKHTLTGEIKIARKLSIVIDRRKLVTPRQTGNYRLKSSREEWKKKLMMRNQQGKGKGKRIWNKSRKSESNKKPRKDIWILKLHQKL